MEEPDAPFAATPSGTRVRFDRVTPPPFGVDAGTSERLALNANGGDDTFAGSNSLGLRRTKSATATAGAARMIRPKR